jgi:hypothetical protein
MFHQQGDIFPALPQRRHGDLDHGDPVVKVFPEATPLDLLPEILVRGSDDADVGPDVAVRPDAPELPRLQGPQDLDLGGRAHFPDLVEEKRPLVGGLEEPMLEAVGAREGAPLVAEQFALQEGVLERPAVDDREGRARPRTVGVDGASDQLLARPALALDQDRGERGSGLGDQGQDAPDGLALAHDLGKGVVGLQGGRQVLALAVADGSLQGASQDGAEVLDVERLTDEVERPFAGGLGRRIDRATLAGRHHHLGGGGHGPQRPEGLEAGHARKLQVEQDQRGLARGGLVNRLFPGTGHADGIAAGGEHPSQERPDARLGMGNEDVGLFHQRILATVNFPSMWTSSSQRGGSEVKKSRSPDLAAGRPLAP